MFVSQSQRTAASQLALGAAVWCNSCHTIHDSEAPDCPVNQKTATPEDRAWNDGYEQGAKKERAETFRIPNGTNITIGDWVGIVVNQSGPNVIVTSEDGGFLKLPRDKIVGRNFIGSKTAASEPCQHCGGRGHFSNGLTCGVCDGTGKDPHLTLSHPHWHGSKPPWLDGDKKDDGDKSKKDGDSDKKGDDSKPGEKLKCPDCGKTYIKEKDGLHQCNTKKSSLDDEIVYQRGKKHYCQACGEWDPRYQRNRRAPVKGITPHDPGTRVKASELPPGTRCADCEGDLTKESGRKHADWANDSTMLEEGDDLGGYQPVKAPDPLSLDEPPFTPQSDTVTAARFAEYVYPDNAAPDDYDPTVYREPYDDYVQESGETKFFDGQAADACRDCAVHRTGR